MKKIKSIKWRVHLSYRNEFVFQSISQAADFMATAVRNSGDREDAEDFELQPIIEFEEDEEQEKQEENEDV